PPFLIGYAADHRPQNGDKLEQKPGSPSSEPSGSSRFGFLGSSTSPNNGIHPSKDLAFLSSPTYSAGDAKRTESQTVFLSFFMAVGNVCGIRRSLHIYCANLKSCFFLSITLLIIVTVSSLWYVKDNNWSPAVNSGDEKTSSVPFFGEILGAFKVMQRPMWMLLIVTTALNWIAWNDRMLKLYNRGVHAGALGLMLQSIVLLFMSLGVEWIGRKVEELNGFGVVNFILAIGLAMTVLISKQAEGHRKTAGDFAGPSSGVRAGALSLFAVLGIPLAITFSIPFALASIFSNSSGAGQAFVGTFDRSFKFGNCDTQMIVSLGGGYFDTLFGGGNLPVFVVGAIAAAISGVLALTVLPSPPPDAPALKSGAMGFH
ncbi:hypothetical protein HID58_090568, partial [Brassica napus]